MMTDRNGSHPMQSILKRIPGILIDEHRDGTADEEGTEAGTDLSLAVHDFRISPTPTRSPV